MSGGRLFQMTGAQTLKERRAHTVFVLGTAIKERVDDHSDIRVPVIQFEMRLFKYAGVAMSRTLNVRTSVELVGSCSAAAAETNTCEALSSVTSLPARRTSSDTQAGKVVIIVCSNFTATILNFLLPVHG